MNGAVHDYAADVATNQFTTEARKRRRGSVALRNLADRQETMRVPKARYLLAQTRQGWVTEHFRQPVGRHLLRNGCRIVINPCFLQEQKALLFETPPLVMLRLVENVTDNRIHLRHADGKRTISLLPSDGVGMIVALVLHSSFGLPLAKLPFPVTVLAGIQVAFYLGMFVVRQRYRRTRDLRAAHFITGYSLAIERGGVLCRPTWYSQRKNLRG